MGRAEPPYSDFSVKPRRNSLRSLIKTYIEQVSQNCQVWVQYKKKTNDSNVHSFPRIQWRIIHSNLKRDIIQRYGAEWNGLGKLSALYSLSGTFFCILDNQFMIKSSLISAYFEAEFSICQPKPNHMTLHQAEPLKQST